MATTGAELYKIALRLGDVDAALVRAAADELVESRRQLRTIRDEMAALHEGRTVVLPRTRKHALDLLAIAEQAVKTFEV